MYLLVAKTFFANSAMYFFPQKVPKTPRQMPSPTSSRLTLAPGDYSRGRTCPVPFARAFSRDFVSRLRHRAGTVRRGSVFSAGQRSEHANMRTCEQGRTSLVRLFAENPGIAPGSGFKPPHSRLQRNKNNRQPACPEREAGKGVRRRGQTACCLPSRHSLNGACFCAVKA